MDNIENYNEVIVPNGEDDFDVEYIPKTREEVLSELGRTEGDVMENERGEFVIVESEDDPYKVYLWIKNLYKLLKSYGIKSKRVR